MYRPDYCRQHMQSKFQLGDQFNVGINVSDAGAGKVKLNTIYPYAYPFTGIYFENIPITMTAVPKPGFRFVRWEGSVTSTNPTITYNMTAPGNFKAVFTPAVLEDYSVVINEINYSSSPEKDTKDWVEIYNNGAAGIDLTGWLLIDSGADSGYVFTQGTTLAPGEYLVICRNLNAFRSYNPEVTNSTGNMQFGLSSDGDIVRLFDIDNRLIDAVNYGVITPWPDSANSTGASIQLMEPDLNNSLGENWRASEKGPTPGKRNYEPVITGTSALQESLASSFSCFPNPFRDFTTISFDVTTEGHYRLEVLDMQGRVIKELANRDLDSGSYWIDWTGEGENNSDQGAGMYMIRLSGERDVVTRKVVRLKR